jgi:hypothetical protein
MKSHRKNPGQSLIEFALLLPLLLVVVMALFDIGRAIFHYSILNTAVREGTRFAIVQSNCDYREFPCACDGDYLDSYPLDCTDAESTANTNICNEVIGKLYDISALADSTITIDHAVSGTDDPMIIIDIDYLFEPITPGINLIGDMTMHVSSQMILTPLAVP